VTKNLPTGIVSDCVKLALLLAILFTYPLQIFPVFEIFETAAFGQPATR
jgi:hypothetical protein